MASALTEVSIRTGTTATKYFSQSGMLGDWQTLHIPFFPFFPATAAGKIRVFATASRQNVLANNGAAPAQPVVGEISPLGFTIWARNGDIVGGQACFNWIAVSEVPDTTPSELGAVFGLLSPQYFATASKQGDWNTYSAPIPVSRQVATATPVIVASGSNANVRVHASASVPVVGVAAADRVSITARNSDPGPGLASFYYLGFLPGLNAPANLMVDTGRVTPLHFSVGSFKGDWQSWTINFADHFISPPVVILTADNYDGSLLSYSVAAVPMANDVTSFGFTLAARNADVAAGWVSFSWLAIGHRA